MDLYRNVKIHLINRIPEMDFLVLKGDRYVVKSMDNKELLVKVHDNAGTIYFENDLNEVYKLGIITQDCYYHEPAICSSVIRSDALFNYVFESLKINPDELYLPVL